jgi:glycosyltransferase involved in cell wall biosynthesis
MAEPNLLTIVLPHTDATRRRLAQTVVAAAARQKYRPVELLVINATEQPLLAVTEAASAVPCREIACPSGMTPAATRNVAFDNVPSGWLSFVDYDDFFHPDRFLLQMASLVGQEPQTASVLGEQLLVDISTAFHPTRDPKTPIPAIAKKKTNRHRGIASTLVVPAQTQLRFDWTLERAEFDEYLARYRQRFPIHVLPTDDTLTTSYSWQLLSVAFFHGRNVLAPAEFFDGATDAALGPAATEYFARLLSSYGLEVSN